MRGSLLSGVPPRARLAGFLALILAVLGGLYLLAMAVRKALRPPASEWNLLWVAIDDFTADRLGVAGYERGITPSLDRLARSGVWGVRCVTQSPWSLPSYASMLSSRYPYELVLNRSYLQHLRAETEVARSRDPYRLPELNVHWYSPLPPDTPLLAAVLKERGFATAAWVNNAWLKPGTYGLERGFGDYHDGLAGRSPYTPADETAAQAAAWIRERAGGRWFAFVQLMDPHRPYQPHPQYAFGTKMADLYDAEVAFTDQAVGELLAALEAAGLADRTVVVVSSDHGEGVFADNADFVGHGGGVAPAIALVPLILRWPGGPAGREYEALCRNLDLMPTVLELLQVAGPAGMQGRSLLPEIRDRVKTSPEPAFTMAVLKGPEQVSVLVQGRKPEDLYQGVVIPAYNQVRVYSLGPDLSPREGAPEAVAAGLITALEKFVGGADRALAEGPPRAPALLDEKTRASLKALGYITE